MPVLTKSLMVERANPYSHVPKLVECLSRRVEVIIMATSILMPMDLECSINTYGSDGPHACGFFKLSIVCRIANIKFNIN